MSTFTILTTTYNRANFLERLYRSLSEQTFKDFVWLIIDDGSIDETYNYICSLVQKPFGTFSEKGEFLGKCDAGFMIEYHYQENAGKTRALKYGFEIIQTPYMVDIDDDDEMTSNCLETFYEEWIKIKRLNISNIVAIRALAIDIMGNVSGKYNPQSDVGYIDSNFLEMEWCRNKHFENITCRDMGLVNQVKMFNDDGKWLYDKVKLVHESLFWNRLARQYDTRYVFIPLRIYHSDSGNYTKAVFTKQKCINYVFSIYNIINELDELQYKNFYRFLILICEYMTCGFALGIRINQLLNALHRRSNRFFCVLVMVPAWLVSLKIRSGFHKL